MNISSVNASSNVSVGNNASQGSNLLSTFSKGQVIEGLITKVSDEISISFSGKEVKASKAAVQNATEGDIRRFEIMDVSEKSIVLKEVGTSTSGTKQNKIVCTTVETNHATFIEQLRDTEGDTEKEEAKEKLDDIASRMTKEDYMALEKEGISLELFELERLSKALERIKTQRMFKEEGSDRQIHNIQEDREVIQKVSIGLISGSLSEKVEQKLEAANLPVTQENIEKIENAMKLAEAASALSDKAVAYLIDNELAPTAENVYKAKYSGDYSNSKTGYEATNKTNNAISKQDWDQIKKQAETVIIKAGMEVNESSLGKARWILENDLALTEDTLQNLEQLAGMKKNYNVEHNLDTIIIAYAKGEQPEKVSLVDNTYISAMKAVKVVNQISDEAIIKVSQNQREVTLKELKQAQEELTVQKSLSSGMNIQEITAKRQLEEIRLKLTVDSAQILIKNGMNLDTTALENIVEGLREQESQYYRSLLQEAEAVDTDENIALLKETSEKISELKSMPSYILGATLQTKEIQTIGTLSAVGNSMKVALDKAGETYEALMTTPRKDLGDSIQKAFRNVDSILADMELETTDANRRAIRILGYNSMEITEEAIMRVKEYDSQVNTFIKNLHPAMTVKMIQEGINPLNTPIEELNGQLETMKDDLGITDEMKYSKYLWQLEKTDGISEEERKTYIGIYRLLNNIAKTDGAAIGSVLQADQKVTLNNLLTAVQTRKASGIDKTVDDTFGLLEKLTYSSETIVEQLTATFSKEAVKVEVDNSQSEKEAISYMSQLVTDVLDTITPDIIRNIGTKENANTNKLFNMSLEEFREAVINQTQEQSGTEVYEEEFVSQVRALTASSEKSIQLLVEYQLPVTVNNIVAANEVINKEKSFFQQVSKQADSLGEQDKAQLKETIEGFVDALENQDTLQEQYTKLTEGLKNILQKSYENPMITSDDMKALKLLGSGMELVTSLSHSQYYEVPVVVGDSVTSMNVTIISGTEDSGKIKLHYDSETLGHMDGLFTIRGEALKGLIVSDNREGLGALQENIHIFEGSLQNMGLNITQLDYATNRRNQEGFITKNVAKTNEKTSKENNLDKVTATATNELLKVAKAFIRSIRVCEMSI